MLRILSKAEDLYAKFDDVNYIFILAKNAKAIHLSVCPAYYLRLESYLEYHIPINM